MSVQEELDALDRVLTRLAFTEDHDMEGVLAKLLPAIIRKLGNNNEALTKKCLQLLSHANKRIHGLSSISLPLEALVDLFVSQRGPAGHPLVRNFSLVYVEMAFPRATPEQQAAATPKLLPGCAHAPSQQREIVLRLAMASMEYHGSSKRYVAGPDEAVKSDWQTLLSSKEDLTVFLKRALLLMLYRPPKSVPVGTRDEQTDAVQLLRQQNEARRMGRPPVAPDAAPAAPPPAGDAFELVAAPGLTLLECKTIEGKGGAIDPPKLQDMKLGVLQLCGMLGVAAEDMLTIYIAAACDPMAPVSSRGEDLLRRGCGIDTLAPSVDLERGDLVRQLFRLIEVPGAPAEEQPPADRERVRRPPSAALHQRTLEVLARSLAAANTFPEALTAMRDAIVGGEGNVRLQQAGMAFAMWVLQKADAQKLSVEMCRGLLQHLLNLLSAGHIAGNQDPAAANLRSFAYQCCGLLAKRCPEAFLGDADIRTDLPQKFFAALHTEPDGTRTGLQECLSLMAVAYAGSPEAVDDLLPMLETAATSDLTAVAVSAQLWVGRIMPFKDPRARHINVMGAADRRPQLRDIVSQGLQIAAGGLRKPGAGDPKAAGRGFPDPLQLVKYFHGKHPKLARAPEGHGEPALHPAQQEALLSLAVDSFRNHFGLGASPAATVDGRQGPARTDAEARAATEAICGLVAHAVGPGTTSALLCLALDAACALCNDSRDAVSQTALAVMAALTRPVRETSLPSVSAGARVRGARLLGILAAKGLGSISEEATLSTLVDAVNDDGQAAAPAAAQSGESSGDKPAAKRQAAAGRQFETIDGAMQCLAHVVPQLHVAGRGASDAVVRRAVDAIKARAKAGQHQAGAVEALSLLGTTPGVLHEEDVTATVDAVLELLKSTNRGDQLKALHASGLLLFGHPQAATLERLLPPVREAARTAEDEAVLLSGEVAAFAVGQLNVTAQDVLSTGLSSLAEWEPYGQLWDKLTEDSSAGPASLPAQAPSHDAAREADRGAALDFSLQMAEEMAVSPRAAERAAAAVWLQSLLRFCGPFSAALRGHLERLQGALVSLLGDMGELAQEMASRALSLAYALGDDALRKQLVANLTGMLKGDKAVLRSAKLEGDSEVFEEGSMGQAPGGKGLTTYRELCDLASELNKPDLIYKFMDLANHQMSLRSRRGAAFGVANIAKIAGVEMEGVSDDVLPRLYRFQFDPNPRVQDQMRAIFTALFPEPAAALERAFDRTAAELLKEMGGRSWRARESACLALSDLLQGRAWGTVRGHYVRAWEMGLRARDDIKDSVRGAADSLLRTLVSITTKLCSRDAASGPGSAAWETAREVLDLVLPVLIDKGLPSKVPEIQNVASSTLSKLVTGAPKEALSPQIHTLVPTLLEGLSGLEDARLNYVEQNASNFGISSSRLEQARVSASKRTPIADAIDALVRQVEKGHLDALVPRLTQLLRRGLGLNTRVGTARFVGMLAMSLGSELKEKAGHLIKALLDGVSTDQSQAVRSAYASAFASLCKIAKPERLEKVAGDLRGMWDADGAGGGGGGDTAVVCALAVRAMSRSAPDAFSQISASLLPVVYMGQFLDGGPAKALFTEVWEDATATPASAIRFHLDGILPLLTASLESEKWPRRRCAYRALTHVAKVGGTALRSTGKAPELLRTLVQQLQGRVWDGKEELLRALPHVLKACAAEADSSAMHVDGEDEGVDTQALISALLDATSKKEKAFREAALTCLGEIAASTPTPGGCAEIVRGVLRPALAAHAATAAVADEKRGASADDAAAAGDGSGDRPKLSLAPAVACVSAALRGPDARSAADEILANDARGLCAVVQAGGRPALEASCLQVLKACIDAATREEDAGAKAATKELAKELGTCLARALRSWEAGAAALRLAAIECCTSLGTALDAAGLADLHALVADSLSKVVKDDVVPSMRAKAKAALAICLPK
ncbi:unnamed protein product [Pedinophyceae sp. YPF-701]|nr:unnamed protein product [Pedinophyceae sp. YPF-701]